MTMRRILVPIDGSQGSVHALDYIAGRRKQGERFEILLLNVQLALPSSHYVSKGMIKQHQQAESEKVLGNPKVRTLQKLLKADAYSEVGEPAETIVKFALKTGCHEIVMAARGLGRLKGLLLGSIATKVVQLSPLPVVIVK
jgi:nucleotide-binding universal stress UspA family protein